MANNNDETTKKQNPKKCNLLDHHSIKHLLDESVIDVIKSRGYVENVRLSNVRLLMGTLIIIIALVAQFYPKKFPDNRNFGLVASYCCAKCRVAADHLLERKGRRRVHLPSTGRFSDMYTLTVESPDPKSIFEKKPVELMKSVTKWFTEDGVLVEGLFWKDVEGQIDNYNNEPKKIND